MKVVLITLALAALVYSAPVEDKDAQTVKSQVDSQPDGSYNFAVETDNGIKREETGELKEVIDEDKKPHVVVVMRGSYSYFDSEGKPVVIQYTADELGFRAEGDTIPKNQARR